MNQGMSIPTPVVLTDDQVSIIMRPVNGRGGFQCLLRALRRRLDGSTLHLTPELAERVSRYATRYGPGGFEGRLGSIVDAARRT